LDADRQNALNVALENSSRTVLRTHPDLGRPFDLLEDPGDRQAALLSIGDTLPREDLGIDQHYGLVMSLRHVDHDQALVEIDLGSCEADAWGGIHGLEHVIDHTSELGVELRHGLRTCA